MATVEVSADELQAIIDGLLFRMGGLSDLADPSHVKEGRISADDAAGWGDEAKLSRELADRLMELRDQADRPREDGDLCALLKFSALRISAPGAARRDVSVSSPIASLSSSPVRRGQHASRFEARGAKNNPNEST
jgi:hypothetical protein